MTKASSKHTTGASAAERRRGKGVVPAKKNRATEPSGLQPTEVGFMGEGGRQSNGWQHTAPPVPLSVSVSVSFGRFIAPEGARA
jgi:hypothetical protein